MESSDRDETPAVAKREAPDEWVSLAASKDGTGVPSFENYYSKIQETFTPLTRAKKLVRKETASPENDSNKYDFTYPKRGLAVIINNEEFDPKTKFGNRNGSTKDAMNLKKMFEHLGFEVLLRNNLTGEEMVKTLQKVASNIDYDHTQADCFACAILSHGDNEDFPPLQPPYDAMLRHDIIYGVDGTIVPTRFLIANFNDECCPELEGKPRLFFIQACRGRDLDDGMDITVLRPKVQLKNVSAGSGQDTGDALPELPLEALQLEGKSDTEEGKSDTEEGKSDKAEGKSDTEEGKSDTEKGKSDTEEGKSDTEEGLAQTKERGESGNTVPQYVYTISPSPIYKDFLLMYATPPGYFAWRNKTDGAWMIQSLTHVLLEEGITDVPLMSLLTKVSRRVSRVKSNARGQMNNKKAVPCVMSMLTKDVYFTSISSPH
ncbi:caspase-3-like isoform X2 [Haliotis rufescens]|uniref:caspase-3-like isoform X2 n=1 Tax=Haliotis rufescens TaxID=6454 RepID=UPI00201E876F|nr:caspase-3-like isoform X2 [Haliotis rufescens]